MVARCRPFTEPEQGKGATRIVKMTGDKTTLQNPQQGGAGKVSIQFCLICQKFFNLYCLFRVEQNDIPINVLFL